MKIKLQAYRMVILVKNGNGDGCHQSVAGELVILGACILQRNGRLEVEVGINMEQYKITIRFCYWDDSLSSYHWNSTQVGVTKAVSRK